MFLDAHQVDELAQVVLGGVSDSGGDDLVRVGEPAQAQQQLPEVAVRPRGGLVAAVRQGDRQRGLQVRDPGRGLLDLGPGEAAVVQHERRQVRSPRRVRELARPFQHGQRRGGPTGQDETRAVVGRGGRQRGAGGDASSVATARAPSRSASSPSPVMNRYRESRTSAAATASVSGAASPARSSSSSAVRPARTASANRWAR